MGLAYFLECSGIQTECQFWYSEVSCNLSVLLISNLNCGKLLFTSLMQKLCWAGESLSWALQENLSGLCGRHWLREDPVKICRDNEKVCLLHWICVLLKDAVCNVLCKISLNSQNVFTQRQSQICLTKILLLRKKWSNILSLNHDLHGGRLIEINQLSHRYFLSWKQPFPLGYLDCFVLFFL